MKRQPDGEIDGTTEYKWQGLTVSIPVSPAQAAALSAEIRQGEEAMRRHLNAALFETPRDPVYRAGWFRRIWWRIFHKEEAGGVNYTKGLEYGKQG